MSSSRTLASSPSLPLELVEEEILCRLPVKILLQLLCICKSWKSLISDDPKFAKKHLHMSKILKHQQHNHHRIVFSTCTGQILCDSPLSSVSTNVSNPTVTQTQLNIPISNSRRISKICSCDGILCVTLDGRGGSAVVLCNPSLRKYSTLPLLEYHRKRKLQYSLFSFGYDNFNDVYKVIAISGSKDKDNEADVYTLGTNYWRSIQDFPHSSPYFHGVGVFVGGTVNWKSYEVSNSSYCRVIVSLDLEKESHQKIAPPNLVKDNWKLGMFRDYLCIFASSNDLGQNPGPYEGMLDVWIMKEYGIKESWTKLFNFSNVEYQYTYLKTGYISDEDQVHAIYFS